ncbi:MAG: DUF6188 family protein [Gemmatimonadaceae bacterium]
MDGLPPDADLRPLVGACVSQICFSRRQYILFFVEDVRVSVESTCELTLPDGQVTSITEYVQAATELCDLLDHTVEAVAREKDGGLTIRFSSGATLRLLNDTREYESFQVHVGTVVYVA